MANPDGPSLPLRRAASGAAEVGVLADSSTGSGAVRLWVRITTDAAQLAIKLADIEDTADTVVIADADCSEAPEGAVLDPSLRSLGDATGTAVVITDGALLDGAELRALSDLHGIDLIVLGLDEVCAPGQAPAPALSEVMARALQADSFGELWAAASSVEVPAEVHEVALQLDHAVVTGPALAAVHRVVEDLTVTDELEDDEPPPWFYALVGFAFLAWVGFKLRRFFVSSDDSAS